MATRFSDPHAMWAKQLELIRELVSSDAPIARFEMHAQTMPGEAEVNEFTSMMFAKHTEEYRELDSLAATIQQAFSNILNANNYEQQEQASQQVPYGSLMETAKAELGTSRHEAGSDAQLAESFLATHGDSFSSSMFSQQGTQPQEPATVNEDLHSEHVLIATDTENQSTDDSVSQGTLTDGEGASHSVQVALETETGDASKDAGSHSEQPGIVPGEDILAPAKAAMETAKAFMEPANPQEGANLTAHDQPAPHSELTMSAMFGQQNSFPSSMFVKAEDGGNLSTQDQTEPHGEVVNVSAMFGQQDNFPSSMFANVGTPTQVPDQALAAEQLPAQTPATESPHAAAPEVESLGNAVPNINPVVDHGDLAP